jgi:hypothetical protein
MGLVAYDIYRGEFGVSAGYYHTCALLSNGNITCWGYNSHGQSANYTSGDAIGVSGGYGHTCALLSNGNITCWGWNGHGQSASYTSGDAIGVSAGYVHTCALLSNGNITCWGNNDYGQSESYTSGDAIGVSAGDFHTCALLSNGNITCWGDNGFDQSENYTSGDVIGVSTGDVHTCALLSNGNITCWGDNNYGKSENYTSGDAIGVSAGGGHTCALLSNGNITCWGLNDDGQSENYTSGDAIGVSAGDEHTCALKSNGDITCWGLNDDGQSENYTSGDAKKQAFYVFQFLNDGTYYINSTACDVFGNCNSTETRQITIDATNPVASLGTNQTNNYNSSASSLVFDLKCSDNIGVSTLQLWSNWTGAWHANQTNATPINDTWWNVTVAGIPDGTWKWGARCNDTAGNVDWTDTNRTLTVDATAPSIQFVAPTPENNHIQAENSIFVNVTSVSIPYDHYTLTDFDRSLVGWWRMDYTNGSLYGAVVYDNSSYGNNGTAAGNANQTTSGKFGKGYDFDGNGDYVEVQSSSWNNTNAMKSSFAVSAWVYPKNNHTNTGRFVAAQPAGANPAGGFAIQFPSTKRIGCSVSNLTGTTVTASIVSGIELNNWYHIVCVFTFNSTHVYSQIYLNGVLNATSVANDMNNGQTFANASNVLRIGAPPNIETAGYSINGTIDEVAIINRTVSAQEILALYSASAKQYYNNFIGLAAGNHTFRSYAIETTGNEGQTEQRTVTVDLITCTPPITGNWNITCSDNCTWTSNLTIPGNITINGTGILNLSALWNFTGTNQYVYIYPGCELNIYRGGGFDP